MDFSLRFFTFRLTCLRTLDLSVLLDQLWSDIFQRTMASQHGAAQATGGPPPPLLEEVTAFFTLIEKVVVAAALRRYARCAELSERAARHAQTLWGDNSLVVVHLRVGEATVIRNMAGTSTSSSEQEALRRRAWAILVPVHALLLRRLGDNTLLPGTVKEEEGTFFARSQAFACKAKDEPVPSEIVLQSFGVTLGYTTLLDAVCNTLASLIETQGFALPRESARSFVLTAFDAIPRTATMRNVVQREADLVMVMDTHMTPRNFEPSFCAAVLRKWRSSAVADVLRARGVL